MFVTKMDYWGFMARISISSLNLIVLLSFSCMVWTCSQAENIGDTLKPGDTLNSTNSLVSASGKFTLEFWKNGTNSSYLVTLDSKSDANQAWVANREMPILYPTGVLTLDMNNTLKVTTQKGGDPPMVLYSAPKSTSVVATLLDSGNFVLQEVNSKKVLWESFDYPADTFLPGMKLGVNHKTGKIWSITSWKTHTSPDMGTFNLDWDPNGHQLELRRRGVVYWRSGKFTGNRFEFILPDERQRYNFSMVSNEYEDYLTYAAVDDQTDEPEWILNFQGRLYDYDDKVGIVEADMCDGYNSDRGCQRRDRTPHCTTGFGFSNNFEQKNGSFKPSNFSSSSSRCPYWLNFASDKNYSSSSTDCQATCWQDCDCIGYDFLFDNQTGCRFWSVDCHFSEDLTGSATTTGFVPMIGTSSSRKKAHDSILIGTAIIAVALVVMVLCIFCCLLRRRKTKLSGKNRTKIYQKELLRFMRSNRSTDVDGLQIDGRMGQDLSVFTYASVLAATCNFSEENKLGQGGFGPVYKGKLVTGEEIAVKKLSKSSGQGVSEFKNELILIYELQHTNLVQLFGFCLHGEERMLIYEYMPNKSLDYFLFDSTRGMFLDWKKRFNIIEGVAQGLIYLHKYSRLRVIHRDLKASNVLLDENMNPKISDFGMAKIFMHNEMEANTSRIVGTRGYMPPEYARDGIFSIKTDVYSFGVLLLEIVSGRKSNSFYNDDHVLNIVGYAWRLWKEGTWLELMDPTLGDSCNRDQFLRCVHVGLLCVEENGEDRPTMLEVIQALTNETMAPPAPTKPAFCIERTAVMTSGMGGGTGPEIESLNDLSISEFTGR